MTNTHSIHRLEIHPKQGFHDPRADAILADAAEAGFEISTLSISRVYIIEGDLSRRDLIVVAEELFTDPLTQRFVIGTAPVRSETGLIEIHPLPGVMDPVAQSASEAIKLLTGKSTRVITGRRYDIAGLSTKEHLTRLAKTLLANPVVEEIHLQQYTPETFPTGQKYKLNLIRVPLRELKDNELQKLSREAHLFLSLEEMQAIAAYYRDLGRDPTDIELETLAQTWSEHCVHKTLKSTVLYTAESRNEDPLSFERRPGHHVLPDGSVRIDNLLASTIAAATHKLISEGLDWTLSVFVDNAGIVRFDDDHAICVKVETHNHPSAIEPYGGAATGIGGCIRDVIGTGLAARPVAATDVFCVAHPDTSNVPDGCLHPRRILKRVVEGVRDYGNRMGIPTISGAVWFDTGYIGNPLVYCGCIGILPANLTGGNAEPGDHIIVLGGATGRGGIHGATFSSAELTDTHATEFSHAVQIGNAIEEKRFLDAILRARDEYSEPLFNAITDCGAGGLSSAVGEMGEKLGATVHLEQAPLKYEGLSYTEIWISEAQERMVLAVPPENIEPLKLICREESVPFCDLGTFGTDDCELILKYENTEVGRLPMHFLHEGLPNSIRKAHWQTFPADNKSLENTAQQQPDPDVTEILCKLLAHPNIASKHWIIRQYDHEVQGTSVIKPLVGPLRSGPSDASVIKPVADSNKGLAISCGLATGIGHPDIGGDPYLMTLAAIDECVRNLVCCGADPERISILDNFCWPSCESPENLASIVRAAEACYDGAIAYRTPFISGKDSLNNQFTSESGETIAIPPTLLITGTGIVPDINKCVTMDVKPGKSILLCIGLTGNHLRGSHAAMLYPSLAAASYFPEVDLSLGPLIARAVHDLIEHELLLAAHDCSDGGLLVAAAEMAFSGHSHDAPSGLSLDLSRIIEIYDSAYVACFAESTSRYLLQVSSKKLDTVCRKLKSADIPFESIGTFNTSGYLSCNNVGLELLLDDLKSIWKSPLDWR